MDDKFKLFFQQHPHPDHVGIESLFRFSKADQPEEHLEHLFVKGKLYHGSPNKFNDPFECKPHFRWPEKAEEVRKIRKHLIKVGREQGLSRTDAERRVGLAMSREGYIRDSIYSAIRKTLSTVRVCSFTSSKSKLLFWAHYADSHRGFCVEYDAKQSPISYAYKVQYSNEYPEAVYPGHRDARALKPVLIKSTVWEYEEEFRTIIVPNVSNQLKHDGTSLILPNEIIKNVYFGALMDDKYKVLITRLLERGPFNPGIWQAKLAASEFNLVFEPVLTPYL